MPTARASRAASALLALLGALACGERAAPAGADSPAATPAPAAAPTGAAQAADSVARPPLPVDSFVPLDEALRRFRTGLGAAPARLAGGASSRDALARDFLRAVAAHDTAALNRAILSRAEFAWLYYPTSAVAAAPYELDPQMAWFQLRSQSEKGIGRVLDRLGGRRLTFEALDCPAAPREEGENRVWEGCALRFTLDGQPARQRLFGGIVARDGAYKFVGYGNDL